MRVKSAADIDKAYRDSLGRVPEAYKAGVAQVNDWKEKAIAGQGLYKEQMQKQEVLDRREKGLQGVSNEEWKTKAGQVGASRIASGMQANAGKRSTNFEPYRAELASIELPARTSDARANVNNRVGLIAERLHAKKVEGGR
jgi:hypothetical protein